MACPLEFHPKNFKLQSSYFLTTHAVLQSRPRQILSFLNKLTQLWPDLEMKQISSHAKTITLFLSCGVRNGSAFSNSLYCSISQFIECLNYNFPQCAIVTIPLSCNEILFRFLNFPAIYGVRYSHLLFETQFCSSYKISLKLNFKLDFFPHFPTPTHTLPGLSWLWTQWCELRVGKERHDLLLTQCLYFLQQISLLSSLSLSLWATFLHTFSEEEKTLLMRLQCSILEGVSGLLWFYLFCFLFCVFVCFYIGGHG